MEHFECFKLFSRRHVWPGTEVDKCILDCVARDDGATFFLNKLHLQRFATVTKESLGFFFEYNLSFSQQVTNLNLEIQKPLAAEKFRYIGFDGQKSSDSNGQTTYFVELDNIPTGSSRLIKISYENPLGITTRDALQELMSISEQKKLPQNPVKQIRRHKLYIWEPLFALGVLSVIIAIVIMNSSVQSLNCSNCEQKLNSNDKYCPKCGEKI